MVPKRFMVVAGEPSGDLLAAELVRALRVELAAREAQPTGDLQPLHTSLAPEFFGAGGPRMAEAGVEIAFDFTRHAVVGLSDVLRKYHVFRRRMRELVALAAERKPHAIICVDFSGFNLRLARAVRRVVEDARGKFLNWRPKIVQFVSPQVWASRPRRAVCLERDVDLLLSIFPFEKNWYAQRAPQLKVEFVGHPIMDRYADYDPPRVGREKPLVLLLPGSREAELRRHVPVMVEAARRLSHPAEVRMVVPDVRLAESARRVLRPEANVAIQAGGLPESLANAELAIAATGTVTLECAYFGVPTIALYKTSWSTYQIGKRIITVKYLSMPNLLAGEAVFPEFIQHQAAPDVIANAANDLLGNPENRKTIREKLRVIVNQLGNPGAPRRAARAIAELVLKSDGQK